MLDLFSITGTYCKTKTNPIAYQLEYSANLNWYSSWIKAKMKIIAWLCMAQNFWGFFHCWCHYIFSNFPKIDTQLTGPENEA